MNFLDTFLENHPVKEMKIDKTTGEYIVGGSGKIGFVVFPGSGQEAVSCFDLIDAFENRYKVIAFSFKGFYDIDTFFAFVNTVLEKEHVDTIILYGLSLGGFLTQHYIKRYKNNVLKLIISHAGTTKSPTIIKKVIKPGKIAYYFLPFIPFPLFRFLAKKMAGPVQSKSSNIKELYEKYSSKINAERRKMFYQKYGLHFLTRNYLKSVYKLGVDMENEEKNWKMSQLEDWSKNILIIRTDNDPLAQDDGMFKQYYPNAKIYTFYQTGHLTPFIQFEKMKEVIDSFIS